MGKSPRFSFFRSTNTPTDRSRLITSKYFNKCKKKFLGHTIYNRYRITFSLRSNCNRATRLLVLIP